LARTDHPECRYGNSVRAIFQFEKAGIAVILASALLLAYMAYVVVGGL
jgi:hypothetical protein